VPAESRDPASTYSGSLMDAIRGTVDEIQGADNTPEAQAGRAVQLVLSNLFLRGPPLDRVFRDQYRPRHQRRPDRVGRRHLAAQQHGGELRARSWRLPVEIIDPLRLVRLASRGIKEEQIKFDSSSIRCRDRPGNRGLAA